MTPDYKNQNLPIEQRLADLLARMTIEEKAAQLYVWGEFNAIGAPDILDADGNLSEQAATHIQDGVCGLGRMSLKRTPRQAAEVTNAIQKYLLEQTRLGIPALCNEEALHGLMATGATSFPQAIAMASTWNPALVEKIFTAAALETRSRGSNYVFTPVLDLAREPRWGRTEETYGEDPYLVSRMGTAAVFGLQGHGPEIDRQHVIATAKHFAVHGQPEGGTNSAPANISERIIREQFLPSFRAAIVEAGAGSVMASYNEIDGVPVHANPWMLRDILRREWGFQGFVTSDGNGVRELINLHHVATDDAEAARKALEAGVDVELGNCFATLAEQVRSGVIAESTLDEAVKHLLRAKFRLGLFDNPYADLELAERVNNCPAHRELALEAARQSIILLKNEGALLPLERSRIKSLAVIGPNAADLHLGGYSYHPASGVTVLDGLKASLGTDVNIIYAEGCRITEGKRDWQAWWSDDVTPPDFDEDSARIAEAVQAARSADVVLLVLGENEATCRESWSKTHLGDRDTLDLPGRQDELGRAILDTGTPVVVLLLNGRPLSINEIARRTPAILEGWYLGQEGGTAVAEVLFGAANPGGKLPITFPRTVGQLPAYYNQKPSGKRGFLFSDVTPLFPFGHGLSYTTFGYQNLRLEPAQIRAGGRTRLSVEVVNLGDRPGDEVVQLYLRDRVSSVTRPVQELKGFERISLQPGECRTVSFFIGPDQLGFLGIHMEYKVEPGLFDVMVGGSSAQVETITLEVIG